MPLAEEKKIGLFTYFFVAIFKLGVYDGFCAKKKR